LIEKEVNQLLSDDWKFAVYYLGDDVALRLLLSSDLTDKIKNRMKLILKFTKPEFPICGDDLIKLGFRQGVDLGKVLKKLEIKWVKSNFLIDKDQLLAETNN
jgi:poly(A) polymerase